MEKILNITVELKEKDYNPLIITREDLVIHKGGGDIFLAVIGIIGEATNDVAVNDLLDKLNDKNREILSKIMSKAYNEISKSLNKIKFK